MPRDSQVVNEFFKLLEEQGAFVQRFGPGYVKVPQGSPDGLVDRRFYVRCRVGENGKLLLSPKQAKLCDELHHPTIVVALHPLTKELRFARHKCFDWIQVEPIKWSEFLSHCRIKELSDQNDSQNDGDVHST